MQAGASEVLERYAADYPQGPHDKPQSMCPAFGSLRVGLRMKRVATVLSGSACCVYGLSFVSHFYGARRSVGYVPFNSETLVTGKLFEDIRDAVHEMADPDQYDAIVVTNLCVLDFQTPDHSMRLASVHPGVGVDEVVEKTGFALTLPEEVPETRAPSGEELQLIREVIDPNHLAEKELLG